MKKKIRFYIGNKNDLNEHEKKYNRISYRRLVERLGDIWLFNQAPALSDYDFEYELNSDYNEETDEYTDIYQYYLFDINSYMIEKLQKLQCTDLIIAWSAKLENYILLVDHFGTSWDYVLTDIIPTTKYDEADL